MSTLTDLFPDRLTLADYRGRKALLVRGELANYAIDLVTHAVFNTDLGKWISIVQKDTNSHRVDSLLTLVMALMNDSIISTYVPTLKHVSN